MKLSVTVLSGSPILRLRSRSAAASRSRPLTLHVLPRAQRPIIVPALPGPSQPLGYLI